MKRNILAMPWLAAALLAVGVAFSACSDFDDFFADSDPDGPYVELTFETEALTRAEISDPFNEAEKKMNTVDVFFYDSQNTQGAPLKVVRFDATSHSAHHKVYIPTDSIDIVFGADNKCNVFAVANVSSEDFTKAGITKKTATIRELLSIKTTTPTFASTFGGFALVSKDNAGDVVEYDPDARAAEGKIHLKNLAAKIGLFVDFGENIQGLHPSYPELGSLSWNVMKSNEVPTSEVHIINGVKSVSLAGFDKGILSDDDYYSIRYDSDFCRPMTKSTEDDKDRYPWATKSSFYSYPNTWDISPLEQYRTSLLLKVDWVAAGGRELTTYYSVPLNLAANMLQSNKYYRIKVKVNSLGGMNFGEPLVLDSEVEVLDWKKTGLEADIRGLRYLEVNQTQKDRDGEEYTAVINGDEGFVTIPFLSSHKTVIKSVKIEYTSYKEAITTNPSDDRKRKVENPGTPVTKTFDKEPELSYFNKSYDELMANNWHGACVDNIGKTITIKHNIGETASGAGYFYPNRGNSQEFTNYTYFITIELTHEDSDDVVATVTLVHHPAIYIEAETNISFNDSTYSYAGQGGDLAWDRHVVGVTQTHFGFVRVNSNSYNSNNFGGTRGIVKHNAAPGSWFDNSSDNPIMYIINVTQLEPGSVYHIKDPRVTTNEVYNIGLSQNNYTAAPYWLNGRFVETGNTHRPAYYYPTNGSPAPEDMYALAPRYRVASAFGITDDELTLEEAKKRCATYCEFGYPAGRWRLPTVGELKYAQDLSNRGLIPRLFNTDRDYVTAQGVYRFPASTIEYPNGSKGWVRCVYDEWYWTTDEGKPDRILDPYNALPNHQIFIWGDKPKPSPQLQ